MKARSKLGEVRISLLAFLLTGIPSMPDAQQTQLEASLERIATVCSGVFNLRAGGDDRPLSVTNERNEYKIMPNFVEVWESGVLLKRIEAFTPNDYRNCVVSILEASRRPIAFDFDGECQLLHASWREWNATLGQFRLGKTDNIVRCGRAKGEDDPIFWRQSRCDKLYASNKIDIDEAAIIFERGAIIFTQMRDLNARGVAATCLPPRDRGPR